MNRLLEMEGGRETVDLLLGIRDGIGDPERLDRLDRIVRLMRPHLEPDRITELDALLEFSPSLWTAEERRRIVAYGRSAVPHLIDRLSDTTVCKRRRTRPDGGGAGTSATGTRVCDNALNLLEEITGRDPGSLHFTGEILENGGPCGILRSPTTEDEEHNTSLRRDWEAWWNARWDRSRREWLEEARSSLERDHEALRGERGLLPELESYIRDLVSFDSRLWTDEERRLVRSNARFAVPFLLDHLGDESIAAHRRRGRRFGRVWMGGGFC